MTVKKIEAFKNWLFEKTNLQEIRPQEYLNRKARRQLKKQLKNE